MQFPHSSNRQVWISDFNTNSTEITVGNDAKLKSVGIGNKEVSIDGNPSIVTVKDVLNVPDLATNLLPVYLSKIAEKGTVTVFDDKC